MESAESAKSATLPQPGGVRKKTLIVIGLVFVGLWAMAIGSMSVAFMIVAGVLTAIAAAIGFWLFRQIKKQQKLASVLQGANDSPEARRQALAELSEGKDKDDHVHIIARAQLLSAESPIEALKLLEPISLKSVSPQVQDDFSILKSQLLLAFGRAKEARPLADSINIDNPQREAFRTSMVAVVAETWARTGASADAIELLDSIEDSETDLGEAEALLLGARVFATFASGKKGKTRTALGKLANIDPNQLGRFISPKSKVHPGLQRLAREALERSGGNKQMRAQAHIAHGGRGRRR